MLSFLIPSRSISDPDRQYGQCHVFDIPNTTCMDLHLAILYLYCTEVLYGWSSLTELLTVNDITVYTVVCDHIMGTLKEKRVHGEKN